MKEFNIIVSIAVALFAIVQTLTLLEQKRMNKAELKVLESNILIDLPEIVATFETFVDITLNTYLSLNRNFKEIDYINAEEEEAILRDVCKEVRETISDNLITKVSLVYNLNTEKALSDLITKTVYLKLLDYISKNNMVKDK